LGRSKLYLGGLLDHIRVSRHRGTKHLQDCSGVGQCSHEATPPELKADTMFAELSRIKGVIDIHCCHAWVIAPQKVAVSAHLHIEDDHHEEVLHSAQILLKHKYGIIHSTLQISEDEDLA